LSVETAATRSFSGRFGNHRYDLGLGTSRDRKKAVINVQE